MGIEEVRVFSLREQATRHFLDDVELLILDVAVCLQFELEVSQPREWAQTGFSESSFGVLSVWSVIFSAGV